jgi:hypothetical protein
MVRPRRQDVSSVSAHIDPREHVLAIPNMTSGMSEVDVESAAAGLDHGRGRWDPMLGDKLIERILPAMAGVDVDHDDSRCGSSTNADVGVHLAQEEVLDPLGVGCRREKSIVRCRMLADGSAGRIST